MTREEAIQVLEEEAEYLYQDDRPYNREAFDMAIEALSDPSIVSCGECKHRPFCNQGVAMHRFHGETIDYWSEMIDFCSYGERREP